MMTTSFRLSRLNYPRATLWSAALLFAAFVIFGLWANAAEPTSGFAAEAARTTTHVAPAAGLRIEDLLNAVCL